MSQDPAFQLNHELRSAGFASLAEAGALIPQLATCIRDERQFRTLINACEPEDRREMYDALVPNLRFKVRPLHDYLIEMANDAARRQLPTIGPDGGLLAYKAPPPIVTDDAIATAAVTEEIAKQHLHVVCVVCTADAVFHGLTKEDVVEAMREAGWRLGYKRVSSTTHDREQVEICPACVHARAPLIHRA